MTRMVRAVALCATLLIGLVSAPWRRIKPSSGMILPTRRSSSRLRSRAKRAPSPNRPRLCAPMPTRPSNEPIFAAAFRFSARSQPSSPADSGNWLRLARTIFQIRPTTSQEQTFLLERASTAAYIAYQRANDSAVEADALAVLGRAFSDRKLWRPALDTLRLSLDLREVADVRAQYEKMRDDHGFRLLDYTVDSDSASPRVCFQFSEDLAKRTDFSPFVDAGRGRPAGAVVRGQTALCRGPQAR